MEKKENLLLLCDTEEEYADLFGEYLRTQRDIPWKIRIYTNPQLIYMRYMLLPGGPMRTVTPLTM